MLLTGFSTPVGNTAPPLKNATTSTDLEERHRRIFIASPSLLAMAIGALAHRSPGLSPQPSRLTHLTLLLAALLDRLVLLVHRTTRLSGDDSQTVCPKELAVRPRSSLPRCFIPTIARDRP